MPTGYTAPIESDVNFTFEDYVWRCAKAHLMEYRDKGLNEPVRIEEASLSTKAYHKKEYEKSLAELKAFNTLNQKELTELFKQDRYEKVERAEKAVNKEIVLKARYDKFKLQAQAWEPPTPTHENMKKFMISQIDESCKFSSVEYYKKELKEVLEQTFEDFIKVKKEKLDWEVNYHKKEMGKSVKRDNGRAVWIQALIDKHGEDKCQKQHS